nr:IS200/IS605 family transposase [Polycladomyces sp. WAk]
MSCGSLIHAHFVFRPRYRRKVLINQVEERFKQMMKDICQENEWDIYAMEVMRDHCHRGCPKPKWTKARSPR